MTGRISAFAAFWYAFIVGDDWRVALGVVMGLAATYFLSLGKFPAWWVLPVAAMILLASSVWRVARRAPRRER